jgi:hypothetical protein
MTATTIEYLDRPPVGDWFVLDVMREKARSREWIAPIDPATKFQPNSGRHHN